MKVDDYHLIVALDETKSLKRAADRLFISQPAVSQRLKSIEEDWGVPIFIRTKRTLFVTTEGEKIINHARRVVLDEESVKTMLRSDANTIEGNLSIGVSSIIGSTILPKVVQKFLSAHPKVNIKLTVGSSPHIVANSKFYHISIVRGEKILNKTNELILQDRHFFLRPKKGDSAQLPMIEFQADRAYLNEIQGFFEEKFNRRYDPQIRVDQMITCKQLLLQGIGTTILPEIALHDCPRDAFEIEEVRLKNRPFKRDTYIAYDENVKQLPQVNAFIKTLKEFVKK